MKISSALFVSLTLALVLMVSPLLAAVKEDPVKDCSSKTKLYLKRTVTDQMFFGLNLLRKWQMGAGGFVVTADMEAVDPDLSVAPSKSGNFSDGTVFFTTSKGATVQGTLFANKGWRFKCVGFSKFDPADMSMAKLTMWQCNFGGEYSRFFSVQDDVYFHGADSEKLFRPWVDPVGQVVRFDECGSE